MPTNWLTSAVFFFSAATLSASATLTITPPVRLLMRVGTRDRHAQLERSNRARPTQRSDTKRNPAYGPPGRNRIHHDRQQGVRRIDILSRGFIRRRSSVCGCPCKLRRSQLLPAHRRQHLGLPIQRPLRHKRILGAVHHRHTNGRQHDLLSLDSNGTRSFDHLNAAPRRRQRRDPGSPHPRATKSTSDPGAKW